MPIKHRRPKARHHRITRRSIELFTTAREHHDRWIDCSRNRCSVPVGDGRCAECLTYIEASVALQRELGLTPADASPLDVDENATESEAEHPDMPYHETLPLVRELRRELLAAGDPSCR